MAHSLRITLFGIIILMLGILITLTLTPTPAEAATCNLYSAAIPVPNGYGASYNVFNASQLLVSLSCNNTTVTVTAGDNDPYTYVYNQGYIYKGSSWIPYSLSCSGGMDLIAGAWCPKQAKATINNATQDSTNYVLAYTCQWRTDAWKCGCKDTTCSTAMWQVQAYPPAQTTPPPVTSSCTTKGSGGGGTINPNSGFEHPGIFVNRDMLEFVKIKIKNKEEPWYGAFNDAKKQFGNTNWTPQAIPVLSCPYGDPKIGCRELQNDANAAFVQSLLWYYTGEDKYAKSAIRIMDAWSGTLTEINQGPGNTVGNAALRAAWVAEIFPRAAEIIRYTYPAGWPKAERFGKMLNDVFKPLIQNGSNANGNWALSMVEGTMNIGIYNDDRTTYNKAVKMWRGETVKYIYLTSDGSAPPAPNKWYMKSTDRYYNGQAQETCRDLAHTEMGFAGLLNAAETAQIQGDDLYASEKKRIDAGVEFLNHYLNLGEGVGVPNDLCGGTLDSYTMWTTLFEIALNKESTHGASLPETKARVKYQRTYPDDSRLHVVFERLSHANIGCAGL